MVSLVDMNEGGNAKRALDALNEEAALAAAPATTTQPDPAAKPDAGKAAGSDEDPRFAGKSRDDILEMYRNLEQHQGRLANELGTQRRTLDELLLQKRSQDLSANGGGIDNVDPAELLTRPREVLDRIVTARARELTEPVLQRLNQLEATLATTTFQTRHADTAQVVNSPEFKAWVNQTGLRRQLAENAAKGNVQAADALLTEFKSSQPAGKGKHLEAALEGAAKVSLEGGASGDPSSKPTGKTYKRADLIALRARDPETYNRLSDEIMRAYREGRVEG